MGIADSFGMAFAKAQASADGALPLEGAVFVTVNDHDKPTVVPIARRFHELGFRVLATAGTQRYLRARGVPAERVFKVYEGRPNGIDLLVSGQIQLLVNTPLGKLTQQDDYAMRRAALQHGIPYTTTMSAAAAACDAIIAHEEPAPGGLLAAGMARAGPGDDGSVTAAAGDGAAPGARDPAIRRRGTRGGDRRGARGGTARPLVDLPHRRPGHGALSRHGRGRRRRRCAWRTGSGVPWFALGLGSNLLFPDAGLDALVIRLGKGLDRSTIRRARSGRSAPGCRRRSPPSAPRRGLGRDPQDGGRSRKRWRGHRDERRLPRRRMERRGADGARRRRHRDRPDHPRGRGRVCLSPQSSRGGRRGRHHGTASPGGRAALEAETEALYKWRKDGTPFNQPCCGSVFQNPGARRRPRPGGAAHGGAVHRGDRPEGHARSAGPSSRRCTPTTSSTPVARPRPT